METLYSTIFVAVLALFGLLVAALIYVAQTVQDRYPAKVAQRLLKGRLSLSFWISGLLTLLLSSIGLFTQAYPSDHVFTFGRSPKMIVSSHGYGMIALLGVFLALLFFILTLRGYARLLSPLTVLREITQGLSPHTLRDVALLRLHKEGERPKVDEAEFKAIFNLLQGVQDNEPKTESKTTAQSKKSLLGQMRYKLQGIIDSHRAKRPSKIEQIKNKLAAKERAGKLEDPLGDLFEYGLSAISKNNALAWQAFLRRLVDVFNQSAQQGLLAKDADVPFLGESLLLQGLERMREEIEIAARYSLSPQLNDAIVEVCEGFMSVDAWERVFPFLTFFQDVGATAISRRDGTLFRSSLRALTDIGIVSIKKEPASSVFDDVCRKIGWLGEKLILRGIEESPIMPSGEETQELGEVTEGIYRLSGAVREGKGEKYPLILRDAMEVICDQALKRNDPQKFEYTILNLLGVHEELAENLIVNESKNAEAYLWLVLDYFNRILSTFDLTKYRELRKGIFSWVGILARETITHNQPVVQFWGAPVDGDRDLQGLIISYVVQMGYPDDWNSAMHEVFIKSHAHIEQGLSFVKRAGAELHSNFGLMFDPETGKDYPSGDPRRR